MNVKLYKYDYDVIISADDELGGAFITFPYDVRAEFGKGRVKVRPHLTASLMTVALLI